MKTVYHLHCTKCGDYPAAYGEDNACSECGGPLEDVIYTDEPMRPEEALEQMTDDWCDGQYCDYTVMSMRDLMHKVIVGYRLLQGKYESLQKIINEEGKGS